MAREDANLIKLQELVRMVFGVNDLKLDSCINELNAVSEENDQFISLFQERFGVDMSKFPYYRYFTEDEFIVLSLFKRLFRKNRKRKLTVHHLLLVMEEGRWFDP